MVLSNHFKDIYEESSRIPSFSLPAVKASSLDIEFVNDYHETPVYNGQKPPLPFAKGDLFFATIINWRRLSANDSNCKSIYEISFDVSGSSFTFSPGDSIGIMPRNHSSDVYALLKHLGLESKADLTYNLQVNGRNGLSHVPVKSTLRHVLTHCLDLRSVVKKLFVLALSIHTKDENEKRVLQYLCSKEGSAIYTKHVLEKRLCVLDLINIFKSCKPPLEVMVSNLPRLLPRPYSIVNSQKSKSNVLKICFSVMELTNKRKGLTTSWLEEVLLKGDSLESGIENLSITERSDEKIPIYLRNNISGFRMPDLDIPLILIGPGSGVSPFIGFLEERQYLKSKCSEIKMGKVWLFFGCRNPKLDFLYEKELNDFVKEGVLNNMCAAFSRVENSEDKYIQDALKRNGKEITQLIRNGAAVFVCGDLNKLANQIKDILIECLMTHGNMSKDEAEKFMCDMHKRKKYFVDTWS